MEQMHEISFKKLKDGTICLEQQLGCEEPSVIHLHPEQLKFIARRMAGLNETTAAQVEDLERKLSILAGDIDFIVKDKSIRRDIIDSDCGSEFELLARLDALWDLAIEFDGSRLLPREAKAPASDLTGRANANAPAKAESPTKSEYSAQLGLDV